MRRRRLARGFRALLLAALAIAAGGLVAVAGDGLTEDDRAVLAWLDRVDLPTAVEKPWVHVTTGWFDRGDDPFAEKDAGAPKVPAVVEGFLLCETPEAYELLPRNALPRTIAKIQDGEEPPQAGAPTLSPADFADDARAYVAALALGKARAMGPWPADFEERVGQRAEAAILARAARDLGLPPLAHDLLEAARAYRERGEEDKPRKCLSEALAGDLSTPVFGRIVVDFGRSTVPRTALRDRLRRFVETFPASEHAERAKATLAIVETMVGEDEEHAKAARPLESLSRDELVRELVFELRDVNGGQFMQPGSPTIWSDPRDDASPAKRLVALGHQAVPALISTIEDPRWTRTVGYWRQFTFSHYVLTVGDAARDILESIAGRSFWQGTYTAASMAKDGEAAEARRRVEAWWAEVREKGEERQLVDTLVGGGKEASGALQRLLEKYPAAVPDAVVRAMPALTDAKERFWVIQGLWSVEDPRVVDLLVKEVAGGPTLECRVRAAATVLRRRGHPEVREAMLREWAAVLRSPPASAFDLPWGFRLLVEFLRGDAGPEGVRALATAVPGLAPDVAAEALETRGSFGDGLDVATRTALEDLYAVALDLDDATGSSTTGDDGASVDIRVCDVAAEGLAALLGREDAFPSRADEATRDAQIAALRSAWRASRKLPAVPPGVPPPPVAKPGVVARASGKGLPEALATRLRAMEGTALDPEAVRALLRAAIEARPAGRARVRVVAHRRPSDGALLLTVEMRALLGDAPDARCFSDVAIRGGARRPAAPRVVGEDPPPPSSLDTVRDALLWLLAPGDGPPASVEASFTRQPGRP